MSARLWPGQPGQAWRPSASGWRSPSGHAAARLVPDLPVLLCLGFLAYALVGTNPMADASSVVSGEGNGSERLALLALAGLAALVIATRARTTLRLARAGWPVWLVLGWFAASVAWADFPEISLRRVAVMVMVTLVSLAIAAGLPSLRRAHRLLLAGLVAVVLADLAVTLIRPGFSITDIGVRGLHPQKNVAGVVAMLASVAALGTLSGAKGTAARLLAAAALAPSLLLLVLTDSKTSLLLAVLSAPLLLVACPLLARVRPARALLVGGFLLLLSLAGLAVAAAFDVDLMALLTPGGDTTFTGRTEIWDLARSEIARRPWTGFGFGSFWDVGEENDPLLRAPPGTWLAQIRVGQDRSFIINEAHNGYLDLALQGGRPGLSLALLLVGLTVLRFAKGAFDGRQGAADRGAAATFLVVMLVFVVHNMTESSLWMRGQIFANVAILLSFLAFRDWHAAPGPAGARP